MAAAWWHLRPFGRPIVLTVLGAGVGLLLPVVDGGPTYVMEHLGPPVLGAILGALAGLIVDVFGSTGTKDPAKLSSTTTAATHWERALLPPAPLNRIGWVVLATAAVVASLLVFPSVIPWMACAWLLWHTIAAFRGRSGVLPLFVCFAVVIVKGVDWPVSLVALLAVMAVVASVRAYTRRKASFPERRITWAGTVALWIAWLWFALDWGAATRATHVQGFDPTRPVVCLGDSLTASGYPRELANRISVPVVDLGVEGITTADALKLLEELTAAEPQAVIIELGGHDYLKGHSRAATAANLEKIINASQAAGAAVVLMEIPRGFVTDPFGGMERELARRHDLELIADTAIRNLVLWSPYAPPGMWGNASSHLSDDGLHPNSRGNAYLANQIVKKLTRMYGPEIVKK